MDKDISRALDFFKGKGNSKTQEQFVEYYFLKDIILEAASNEEKLDVARSDFDAFGFDLLISRHNSSQSKTVNIQLKATSGKCRIWDVHKSLVELDNGRIIIVYLSLGKSVNNEVSVVPKYLMFDKTFKDEALRTKPKIDKPYKCMVKLNQFKDISADILSIFD